MPQNLNERKNKGHYKIYGAGMKETLLSLNKKELGEVMAALGEKSYRAGQVLRAQSSGLCFDEMTELSKPLRARLKESYGDFPVKIIKTLKSRDGTEKYLFSLADGNVIEGVLMKYKYGNTLCVSTQVGCRMNCAFCASGISGLVRNLDAGEILGEVIAVNRKTGGGLSDERKVTNVVLMGSGEPLDNYENTVKFLRLLGEKEGLNMSCRNVSLSTCGLVPQMRMLAEEGLPVNLTVSLHSPFDGERAKIMPVAKSYSIAEILDACAYYFSRTGRRYIFEYVLIGGENADNRHARALIGLLKGKPCHVNLIRLNDVKEKGLKGCSERDAREFLRELTAGGLSATLRRRMGEDIEGACGQLRRRFLSEETGADPNEVCAGKTKETGGI